MPEKTHKAVMMILAILAILVPVVVMAVTGIFRLKTEFAVLNTIVTTNSGIIKEIRTDVRELKDTTAMLKSDLRAHEIITNGKKGKRDDK